MAKKAKSSGATGTDFWRLAKVDETPEVTDTQGTRRGEGFRLYDLRHTCATLLLLADMPAKIVSERLGHRSVTVTLDTYSHVLPPLQKRVADSIRKFLGGQVKFQE